MHKSLVFAVFLLPIFGYGITKETRIKELKEAEYNKVLELQGLVVQMRKIASQYYGYQEYEDFFDVAVTKSDKSEEEIKKYNTELEINLANSLFNGQDIKIDFSRELFYKDSSFDAFKGLFVESAVEKYLLTLMTERLIKCFNELLTIKKEIKNIRG